MLCRRTKRRWFRHQSMLSMFGCGNNSWHQADTDYWTMYGLFFFYLYKYVCTPVIIIIITNFKQRNVRIFPILSNIVHALAIDIRQTITVLDFNNTVYSMHYRWQRLSVLDVNQSWTTTRHLTHLLPGIASYELELFLLK